MKDYLKDYDLVEVTWLDAADEDDMKLDDLLAGSVKDILYERKTYGRLIKEDDNGVLLVTDIMQDSTCECVAIPTYMLQKINYGVGRNGKKSNKKFEELEGCSRSAGEKHIV